MKTTEFKNALPENQKQMTQSGFTLVEISIVMIIIGLLISGIFGGMKLVDNANVQRTVQDLKAIESAALTFRDTYRALPGDIRNQNTRIPNCTAAPCANTGNGNRVVGLAQLSEGAITNTSENFSFWSQLLASEIISLKIKNSTDMTFGEGQPESEISGGYRVSNFNRSWVTGGTNMRTVILITAFDSAATMGSNDSIKCSSLEQIDKKIDDGHTILGRMQASWCLSEFPITPTTILYVNNQLGTGLYDMRSF